MVASVAVELLEAFPITMAPVFVVDADVPVMLNAWGVVVGAMGVVAVAPPNENPPNDAVAVAAAVDEAAGVAGIAAGVDAPTKLKPSAAGNF